MNPFKAIGKLFREGIDFLSMENYIQTWGPTWPEGMDGPPPSTGIETTCYVCEDTNPEWYLAHPKREHQGIGFVRLTPDSPGIPCYMDEHGLYYVMDPRTNERMDLICA